MRGGFGTGGNVGRHLAYEVELLAGGIRKQRDDQIFQSDDADSQLDQLGIG